jgi:hypothetical protein
VQLEPSHETQQIRRRRLGGEHPDVELDPVAVEPHPGRQAAERRNQP